MPSEFKKKNTMGLFSVFINYAGFHTMTSVLSWSAFEMIETIEKPTSNISNKWSHSREQGYFLKYAAKKRAHNQHNTTQIDLYKMPSKER